MTMPELVAFLMQWISLNSEYSTIDVPPPEIVLMTPAEITAEYYDAAGVDAASRRPVDPRVLALYAFEDGPHGTVYLLGPEPADPGDDALGDPYFQERLLHELVHHVQRHAGAYDRFRCRAEGEVDAYRLGGLFLSQRRVEDHLPNRAFWARVYSRC
jgi:hypothetical protein